MVQLEPSHTESVNDVRCSVGAWEEVTDLFARFDVVLRDAMGAHELNVLGFQRFADLVFTDVFHDGESFGVINSVFVDEGVHDIVTASNDFLKGRGFVFDQILGVVVPDIGTVADA